MKSILIAITLLGTQFSFACDQFPDDLNLKKVIFEFATITGDMEINIEMPNLKLAPCKTPENRTFDVFIFKKLDPPIKVTYINKTTGNITQTIEASKIIASNSRDEKNGMHMNLSGLSKKMVHLFPVGLGFYPNSNEYYFYLSNGSGPSKEGVYLTAKSIETW
tara:strand:+ start:1294 stop:1782 length:489 start_codon:yes stop_codon:yes gene_type:complete